MTKTKTISFTKIAGAGNDFIIINASRGMNYKKLAIAICNRTTGIGADGLLILDSSHKTDYRMRIINADGSEAEMCGNGARCLASYIIQTHKTKRLEFGMETLAGIIAAKIKNNKVSICLSEPKDYKPDVPIQILGRDITVHYIDTGVPHVVVFVNGLDNIDVQNIGQAIRTHEAFAPRGTNVNFVEEIKPEMSAVRTYERGVENETKACGTGSVASAIISFLQSNPQISEIRQAKRKVLTQSGEILDVSFDLKASHIQNVWLTGETHLIATGKYFYA